MHAHMTGSFVALTMLCPSKNNIEMKFFKIISIVAIPERNWISHSQLWKLMPITDRDKMHETPQFYAKGIRVLTKEDRRN